jgi:hypothetical protein
MDKLGDAPMIQNGEKTSEAEQLRQVDQQAVSRHLGVRNRQIVHTEEPEQWLSVPPSPPLGRPASGVSFITDWADS